MKTVQIFTDGACSGNPGPGGWGAILRYGTAEKELSGGEHETTNNRMELTGVIEALSVQRSADYGQQIRGGQHHQGLGLRLAETGLGQVGQEACTECGLVETAAPAAGKASGHIPLGQGTRRSPRKRTLRPAGSDAAGSECVMSYSPDNDRNIAHIPANGKVPTLSSEDFSCIIGVKMKK